MKVSRHTGYVTVPGARETEFQRISNRVGHPLHPSAYGATVPGGAHGGGAVRTPWSNALAEFVQRYLHQEPGDKPRPPVTRHDCRLLVDHALGLTEGEDGCRGGTTAPAQAPAATDAMKTKRGGRDKAPLLTRYLEALQHEISRFCWCAVPVVDAGGVQ
jgi:hypothetical protein